jgi:chromosome segregation ATPase
MPKYENNSAILSQEMNQNIESIQRIGQKLHHLVKQRDALLREKEKLQQELVHLKKENEHQTKQLHALEEQVAILKSASTHMTDKEKKEFEKRINGYIKELDKVIAHMQA